MLNDWEHTQYYTKNLFLAFIKYWCNIIFRYFMLFIIAFRILLLNNPVLSWLALRGLFLCVLSNYDEYIIIISSIILGVSKIIFYISDNDSRTIFKTKLYELHPEMKTEK